MRHTLFVPALLTLLAFPPLAAAADPVPLIHAHAHNDYLHPRPLLDALEQGFCSVEADIHLVDGKLLVAHDLPLARPERTLEKLYLEPLRERMAKNGGRVYPNGPEFSLLIDLKSNWQTTYPVLREVLKQYKDIFSSFRSGQKQTNAVLAVISGSRSLKMFDGEEVRYAAYDGQLPDLDSSEPAALIPWISANWRSNFKWAGAGDLPADEREKLVQIVDKAHQAGRRVRFWGAPDTEMFWKEMRKCNVDLINTDNLRGLKDFLTPQ